MDNTTGMWTGMHTDRNRYHDETGDRDTDSNEECDDGDYGDTDSNGNYDDGEDYDLMIWYQSIKDIVSNFKTIFIITLELEESWVS